MRHRNASSSHLKAASLDDLRNRISMYSVVSVRQSEYDKVTFGLRLHKLTRVECGPRVLVSAQSGSLDSPNRWVRRTANWECGIFGGALPITRASSTYTLTRARADQKNHQNGGRQMGLAQHRACRRHPVPGVAHDRASAGGKRRQVPLALQQLPPLSRECADPGRKRRCCCGWRGAPRVQALHAGGAEEVSTCISCVAEEIAYAY